MIQKLIAGATTDDVKDLDGIVCHGVQLFDNEAILQCQAFEDTSYIFACRFWTRLTCPFAKRIDSGGHVGGIQEQHVIRVDYALEG